MKIPRKCFIAILASLLLLAVVIGAVVITIRLGTRVTLRVPDDIQTDITSWDWGTLTMVGDFANSTQNVLFTSYGAVPLTLTAMADQTSMNPSWFTPQYYDLAWSGQAYEIQPLESILTTFTLTVDVTMARSYMIANQIPEVEILFDIEVSVSNISLPHYFLTVETTIGGTTDPAPGIHEYVEGTLVPVTAIPDLGYNLDYWILDVIARPENPTDVLMLENHTITAYFVVAGPKVYVDPESTNVAPGGTFTIEVKVGNIEDLYGFDILFSWNPAILEYASHTMKVPVETYPDGILYSPTLLILDTVNSPGGTYNLAITSMTPAASFNGTGTAFEMTFNVLGIGTSILDIGPADFADPGGFVLTVEIQDGIFDNT